MASLPPSPCSLPRDALYEILLRLPAKDLCRLRAVCPEWRSLLSDPRFVAAHAIRHPGPLIVAGYERPKEGIICDILDLSGRVVMRIPAQEGVRRVMSIQLNLICTEKRMTLDCQLLNPVTRAVCALPEGFAKEHAQKRGIFDHKVFLSFGKAPLTGECKVLRILDNLSDIRPKQLCEIFTLGGKDSQWRKKKAPEDIVYLGCCKSVVMDGIVYFLSYLDGCIASFNLHTEVWSKALHGPLSSLADAKMKNRFMLLTCQAMC
nr:unnamed protein product [Digitaria exilis]